MSRSATLARVSAPRLVALVLAGAALVSAGPEAKAFPHVVKKGETAVPMPNLETLAQIAERTYGRVQMEQILVAANGLDAGGGIPIVAGMRLEVPAVGHHRVTAGETWAGLAEALLGDERRSDVLAIANGSMPWLPPSDGQELIVPYNLRYVVGQHDSLLTIAYRFLGERDKAWMLDGYNRRKGDPVRRGDVVLVPLTELPLTRAGRAEAASAGALVRTEAEGKAREAQRRVDAELPLLAGEVRAGRWVDAVSRANRMLGYGDLSRPELAAIQRALTEAYVALDAEGLAETACTAWREADPTSVLDPVELSPKILRACVSAAGVRPAPPVEVPDAGPVDAGAEPSPLPPRTRGRGRAGGG